MPHCMAASTLFEPIQLHEAHKSLFNITIATSQSAQSGTLCVCDTELDREGTIYMYLPYLTLLPSCAILMKSPQ